MNLHSAITIYSSLLNLIVMLNKGTRKTKSSTRLFFPLTLNIWGRLQVLFDDLGYLKKGKLIYGKRRNNNFSVVLI